jgi:hypothetical protein
MKSNKNVFVVKHGEEWATKISGNQRVTKTFDTQKEAIDAGKTQARINQN